MSLAAIKRPRFFDLAQSSDHCRLKRLKPKQQSGALGPQYVGTMKLYRSATARVRKINPGAVRANSAR
jgi:hypothetical protein